MAAAASRSAPAQTSRLTLRNYLADAAEAVLATAKEQIARHADDSQPAGAVRSEGVFA